MCTLTKKENEQKLKEKKLKRASYQENSFSCKGVCDSLQNNDQETKALRRQSQLIMISVLKSTQRKTQKNDRLPTTQHVCQMTWSSSTMFLVWNPTFG